MDDAQEAKLFLQVNAWIREAVGEMGKGNLDHARELFTKVIEKAPAFADAHYNLGVICDMQGQPDRAIKHYEQTIRINPKHAQCLTNLGAAHSNAGRPKIAVPLFLRAIENDPVLIQPRINLGITYRAMEEPDQAFTALKEAVGVEPRNARVLYLAGCAGQESGRATEAERYLRSALDINPSYTDAVIVLAEVLLELESPGDAIKVLEQFLTTNPNNASARECLSRIRSADLTRD